MNKSNITNHWKINLVTEREFIKKYIIGSFINMPDKCTFYNIGTLRIKNTDSYNNPIQWKFNN